ncbi:hypothetical protein EMMF5_002884 [Cystobasidiomycetes sp. EMM_F5]
MATTEKTMYPATGQQQQHAHLSDHSSDDDTRNDQVGHHGDEQEEYAGLLDYVARFAEKKTGGGAATGDGSYVKKHRKWYTPWKTYDVKYDRNGEVIPHDSAIVTPEDW